MSERFIIFWLFGCYATHFIFETFYGGIRTKKKRRRYKRLESFFTLICLWPMVLAITAIGLAFGVSRDEVQAMVDADDE